MSVIASCGSDKTVRFWIMEDGTNFKTIMSAPRIELYCVRFSPSGEYICFCGLDACVFLFTYPNLHWVQYFFCEWELSTCASFNRTNDMLVSTSYDGFIHLWEINERQEDLQLQHNEVPKAACCCSKTDNRVAVASSITVQIWDLDTKLLLTVLEGHTDHVKSVDFSYDDHYIASASKDRTVIIWELDHLKAFHTLVGHTAAVMSVCFNVYASSVVSGSDDHTARIWDVNTGECWFVLSGHTAVVNSVCFSEDGSMVVTGSDDTTLKIWDSYTGEEKRTLIGHTGPVKSVTCLFNPPGSYI